MLSALGPRVKERWDALTDAKKKPYEKLAADDKVRLEKEREQLCTYGYFINADGVRSTELTRKLGKRERAAALEKAKLDREEQKKLDKQIDTDDENKAWAYYYNKCYNKEFKAAPGKSEAAKKKNADKLLQNNWLKMAIGTKKRYVNHAKKND